MAPRLRWQRAVFLLMLLTFGEARGHTPSWHGFYYNFRSGIVVIVGTNPAGGTAILGWAPLDKLSASGISHMPDTVPSGIYKVRVDASQLEGTVLIVPDHKAQGNSGQVKPLIKRPDGKVISVRPVTTMTKPKATLAPFQLHKCTQAALANTIKSISSASLGATALGVLGAQAYSEGRKKFRALIGCFCGAVKAVMEAREKACEEAVHFNVFAEWLETEKHLPIDVDTIDKAKQRYPKEWQEWQVTGDVSGDLITGAEKECLNALPPVRNQVGLFIRPAHPLTPGNLKDGSEILCVGGRVINPLTCQPYDDALNNSDHECDPAKLSPVTKLPMARENEKDKPVEWIDPNGPEFCKRYGK